MKIVVTDRESVERGLSLKSNYVLISIRDPEKPRAKIPKTSKLKATFHAAFHDTMPSEWPDVPDDITFLETGQAARIWTFVQRYWNEVGVIVVHCHYGKSRSPAVAAAIARYLGMDWEEYFDLYVPNEYVFKVMVETAPRR